MKLVLFNKNGWEWIGVVGSGWDRVGVDGSGWEHKMVMPKFQSYLETYS